MGLARMRFSTVVGDKTRAQLALIREPVSHWRRHLPAAERDDAWKALERTTEVAVLRDLLAIALDADEESRRRAARLIVHIVGALCVEDLPRLDDWLRHAGPAIGKWDDAWHRLTPRAMQAVRVSDGWATALL